MTRFFEGNQLQMKKLVDVCLILFGVITGLWWLEAGYQYLMLSGDYRVCIIFVIITMAPILVLMILVQAGPETPTEADNTPAVGAGSFPTIAKTGFDRLARISLILIPLVISGLIFNCAAQHFKKHHLADLQAVAKLKSVLLVVTDPTLVSVAEYQRDLQALGGASTPAGGFLAAHWGSWHTQMPTGVYRLLMKRADYLWQLQKQHLISGAVDFNGYSSRQVRRKLHHVSGRLGADAQRMNGQDRTLPDLTDLNRVYQDLRRDLAAHRNPRTIFCVYQQLLIPTVIDWKPQSTTSEIANFESSATKVSPAFAAKVWVTNNLEGLTQADMTHKLRVLERTQTG